MTKFPGTSQMVKIPWPGKKFIFPRLYPDPWTPWKIANADITCEWTVNLAQWNCTRTLPVHWAQLHRANTSCRAVPVRWSRVSLLFDLLTELRGLRFLHPRRPAAQSVNWASPWTHRCWPHRRPHQTIRRRPTIRPSVTTIRIIQYKYNTLSATKCTEHWYITWKIRPIDKCYFYYTIQFQLFPDMRLIEALFAKIS